MGGRIRIETTADIGQRSLLKSKSLSYSTSVDSLQNNHIQICSSLQLLAFVSWPFRQPFPKVMVQHQAIAISISNNIKFKDHKMSLEKMPSNNYPLVAVWNTELSIQLLKRKKLKRNVPKNPGECARKNTKGFVILTKTKFVGKHMKKSATPSTGTIALKLSEMWMNHGKLKNVRTKLLKYANKLGLTKAMREKFGVTIQPLVNI